MRRYLESAIDFEWPEDVGERDGNHCRLNRHYIPLKWLERISDKNASIDIYMGGEQYAFKEKFAVKTIREKTTTKAKTRARNEVENMRDLRFPHVAALLGSFSYMDLISKEMRDLRGGRSPLQELANQRPRADTPDSRSSTSKSIERPGSPISSTHSLDSPSATVVHEVWPLKMPLPAKVDSLRGYFVCLSQALSYIHESDVRHKDIKPENILIDASGSVVLTDFGISRRFPKKTSHVTNDKWEWTRKYASPEIMQSQRAPRDDPSDVFSLGCVFLEMASLILGRDLQTMCHHYASTVNDSGLEDAYYCNLERVYDWIEHMAKPRESEPRSAPDLTGEKIIGQDFVPDLRSRMVEALATLRLMLDIDPHKRPTAKSLWERFQHVSAQMCRDCDPRSKEKWTPNPRQRDAAESGTKARQRSRQIIPEKAMDFSDMETRDGQSENEHLLNPYYRLDRNGSMGRRASSPNTGRNQTHTRRQYNSPPILVRPPIDDGSNLDGSTGPAVPVVEGSQMRRTSSALDGRRATVQEIPSASRSMSPRKRRPFAESRLQPGVAQAPDTSVPPLPIPPSKRDKVQHPSPSCRNEHVPVAQNSLGSSHSLAVKKQTSKSEDSGVEEKSGQDGHGAHQKQEQLDSSTQILIYDLAKRIAYVGAYAQVEGKFNLFRKMICLISVDQTYGKDYISRPLPRFAQKIEIGERGSPIATVDLGSLGTWTNVKRVAGGFPTLYVLNFAQQPSG
ncbi:MAG: hypothetical protein LQ343_003502 [Gyalolechia ehrenbergii]|nr:MAG: hypothetical protein LQ343_003502 [Gyalolechia ehrenbergii]